MVLHQARFFDATIGRHFRDYKKIMFFVGLGITLLIPRAAVSQSQKEVPGKAAEGKVSTATKLDQEFASTYHALAQYHYLRATESWTKKETAKGGQELRAASTYLESGVKEAGGKEGREVRLLIEDTRTLAGRLVRGAGWVNAEVEKGIKALGVEIERLGENMKILAESPIGLSQKRNAIVCTKSESLMPRSMILPSEGFGRKSS